MKLLNIFLCTMIVCSFLWAQQEEALAERIKQVSEGLLEGYTQPLITAFGTGISTGLFHSAYSHDLLGFDLGVRVMLIHIPGHAKYFSDTALACSLGTGGLEYYDVPLDNMSTIFGPEDSTYVPTQSTGAVGIPTFVPGGFDLPAVPLVMPQLNVGLIMGSEIAIRYIPFTFEQSKIKFLGIGAKWELTRMPFFKPIPVAIAIGGAFQNFSIKDNLDQNIVSSKTGNLQVLVSKRIVVFEPTVGAGLEWTSVDFRYDFEYDIPDSISGVPYTVSVPVNVNIRAQNNYRVFAGFTLRLGFFYLHYDFNLLPYKTHNGIIGLTFR